MDLCFHRPSVIAGRAAGVAASQSAADNSAPEAAGASGAELD